MAMKFIRQWLEGLAPIAAEPPMAAPQPMGIEQPMPAEPSLDVPDFEQPSPPAPAKKPLGAVGEEDTNEGTVIGNLGAKVVSTLVDWTSPEGGFLLRVKNPDVLDEGIKRLWDSIQTFNRRSSRMISRSVTETKGLRDIQSPWFFTAGARLQSLKSRSKDDRDKALTQLQVLAPQLESKWNKFIGENKIGIRVTNPQMIEEPSGAPEEEIGPEPMGQGPAAPPEPEFPDIMGGAPAGPGLSQPGQSIGMGVIPPM